MDWFLLAYRRYAVFQGRARRTEYWMFFLMYLVVFLFLAAMDGLLGRWDEKAGIGLLSGLFALGSLLPGLGLAVRRLHDTDRSGWWVLVGCIPLVGFLVLMYFAARRGTPGDNRFGPDPLAAPPDPLAL